MRKTMIYIIRKRNFFVMMFLFCILLSGCNSKMKFEKSQDEFNTTYKNENIEVQIANNVENSEEIFQSIERDLNIINNFEPIEKLTVRVDNKFLKGNDKSGVECNGEFVKTPQFKQLLIANAYDLYDNWKAVGIYGNLFGDEMNVNFVSTNANDKATEQNQGKVDFVSYYRNHNFSLFGAHFFPDFSSEEEIKNLTFASTSLVKYLLDNGKKEKLLKEEISIEDIKPWAEQNNIDLTYLEALYNHINEIRVSNPSEFMKLYIDTRRDINGYSMELAAPGEEFDTASELENAIKFFDENIEKHRQLMKEKAPNFYKEYEKPLTQVPKIIYEINAVGGSNSFDEFDNRVYFTSRSVHLHEYCHYLMKASFENHGIKITKPAWVVEGIDPYLDYYYHLYNSKDSMNSYIERNILDIEHFEKTKKEEPVRYNRLKVYADVLRANFTIEELADFDKIYRDEEKYKKLVHIKYGSALGYPKAYQIFGLTDSRLRAFNLGRHSYPGISEANNQNYYANVSFFGYLVETYGYEKMLYFSVQDFSKITFEEYFGKSYKELDADWKKYLIDNIVDGELLVYGDKG